MRAFALAGLSFLLLAALSGCVNGADETSGATSQTDAPGDPVQTASDWSATPSSSARAVAPRLAPLGVNVSLTGPQWVASGSEVPVAAIVTGATKFVWATGPLPLTSPAKVADLDTKVFDPGASKSLKFTSAGVYAMHCHPHPFMKHNVTVIDGYQSAARVTVLITDGATNGEYRFSPENIVVGVGTEVVYENVGKLPHSATQEGQEPALKLAKLSASTGTVALEGEGWQRIVAIASDSGGRVGVGEARVYLTKELPTSASVDVAGSFTTPLYLPDVEANPEPARMTSMKVDHPGEFTLNITATDDNAGLAKVSVRVVRVATDEEVGALDATAAGTLAFTIERGEYEIDVEPSEGFNVDYEGVATVVYDLTPPPPMPPGSAAAEDPHAGH